MSTTTTETEIPDMHQHEEEYPSLTCSSSSSSDDDSYSTGGDSGFSMGQDEQEHNKKQETPEIAVADSSTTATMSFFSRFASIPIIQDGFVGAQNMVKQHAVGQKALDYAETKLQTILSTAQPYCENNKVIVCANHIGNRSLDLIESKFPLIINTPTDKLLVEPIKGHIAQAAHVVNPRIDYIADQFERLMEQYLPAEDEQQEKEQEKHGMERLMHVVNLLSSRTSKKISNKASATMEEERQIKQMIRTWVLEQVHVMTQHQQQQWPQLQEQMESFKAKFSPTIQTMYDFTHCEFDKFRQELFKPNTSHLDRIRNILVLSQTDILMPLYQKSYSLWKSNNSVAAVANE